MPRSSPPTGRYVVETFFARVKSFQFLKGIVPCGAIRLVERPWVCALAATDLHAPLRKPATRDKTQEELRAAGPKLAASLRREAGGQALPWCFQMRR